MDKRLSSALLQIINTSTGYTAHNAIVSDGYQQSKQNRLSQKARRKRAKWVNNRRAK